MMAFKTSVMAIAVLAAACAQQPPEKHPPAVSVPVRLIASVCSRAHTDQGDGNWDRNAQLLWSRDGSTVIAIECDLTVFVDGLTTTAARIRLDDPRARDLRDFLESRAAK